jgi:uncharacterized protein (DUF1697 family)
MVMVTYVALLRAVNVGGTGAISMRDLVGLCSDLGLVDVRTYIQSGNIVLVSTFRREGSNESRERTGKGHWETNRCISTDPDETRL